MFLAIAGVQEATDQWLLTAARHASSLGMPIGSARLGADAGAAIAWWGEGPGTAPRHSGDLVHLSGTPLPLRSDLSEAAVRRLWSGPAAADLPNSVQLLASATSGELRMIVPPASPEQLFHAAVPGGRVYTDDLRLLAVALDPEIDPIAAQALLQYCAVPAPLSIFRGVRRAPPGHTLRHAPGADGPVATRFFDATRPLPPGTPSDPDEAVASVLDPLLGELPDGSAVMFSGGIDSTLLAARLTEIGRRDVTLVHFSLGPGDVETPAARKLAGRLGLPFEQLDWHRDDVGWVFDRLGRDYLHPFGDPAVTPARLLVRGALERANVPAAADGSGAGIFTQWRRLGQWSRLYESPSAVRRLLAAAYGPLRGWRRQGDWERRMDKSRRSVQMPVHTAVMAAMNSLGGLAYPVPDRQAVDSLVVDMVDEVGEGLELEKWICLLDAVHVCAGALTAKSAHPLWTAGAGSLMPMMEPRMLEVVFGLRWDERFRSDDKIVLKRLLARTVGEDLSRRPKSPFFPPFAELAGHGRFQELARDALSGDGPLRPYVRPRVVAAMLRRARRGGGLSVGAYTFLATFVSVSAWLGQVRAQASAGEPAGSPPPPGRAACAEAPAHLR